MLYFQVKRKFNKGGRVGLKGGSFPDLNQVMVKLL